MIDIVFDFVASYILSFTFNFSWEEFYRLKNIKIYNKKIQTTMICLAIIIVTINQIIGNNQIIKIILTMISMIFANYFIYRNDIKNTIISILNTQIIIMISELITMIAINFEFYDGSKILIDSTIGYFIMNIFIAFIYFIIILTKIPIRVYDIMIKFTETIKGSDILIYTLIIMAIAIISTAASYLHWKAITVLFINTMLVLLFLFISIKFANAQNKYNEISNKYETSISSLRQYEAMIDKYRLYNHENKNELQTLRNLISKKNTKALKYIDGILEDKIKDNEKIMRKTFKIPEGGLRAIIYGKLCKMDELGIKYSLDIARDIRTVDLINMDEEIVLNMCKILGVFLDNAIEAVKNLKEKQITIEIYLMDGKLCIDITNNFEGKLELDKLDKEKYTTKGKNHGYGLSLVKQIIGDNSNIFENEKSISRNTFTQKLKIKM